MRAAARFLTRRAAYPSNRRLPSPARRARSTDLRPKACRRPRRRRSRIGRASPSRRSGRVLDAARRRPDAPARSMFPVRRGERTGCTFLRRLRERSELDRGATEERLGGRKAPSASTPPIPAPRPEACAGCRNRAGYGRSRTHCSHAGGRHPCARGDIGTLQGRRSHLRALPGHLRSGHPVLQVLRRPLRGRAPRQRIPSSGTASPATADRSTASAPAAGHPRSGPAYTRVRCPAATVRRPAGRTAPSPSGCDPVSPLAESVRRHASTRTGPRRVYAGGDPPSPAVE